MKIRSKYIYIIKIITIVLLSLAGTWLFWKGLYFTTVLILAGIIALAISLYNDRKKLFERMEHIICGIRHVDFSTHFRTTHSDDELDSLMNEMDETLNVFRTRTHDSMMEEAETKAWQKLISVLTHEIMNSIAPIISLSETLAEQEIPEKYDSEEYRIMKQAMETIHRRSEGLLSFVENYRKLTRLPQPVFQPISLRQMLTSLQQLTSTDDIEFSFKVYPEQLILSADKGMMEQLLLNLLKNAREASIGNDESKIEVNAEKMGNHIRIIVSDNGHGISSEALDKIFIPFYSTKANGSGIGLSLCRQIVIRHKGKISVQSDKSGSQFIIEFPE